MLRSTATTARDDAVAVPSDAHIRAALARVLACSNFRASPQLASFLSFVVEETLAGQADHIKGYSVAVGALGRSDTFDPQTNPIGRVEAGRLRRALGTLLRGSGSRGRTRHQASARKLHPYVRTP